MAKKRAPEPAPAPKRDEGKARFELRFDADLYEKLKALADGADISMNQLMQGIARWAAKYGHVGEADIREYMGGADVVVKDQPGCVWFGHQGEEAGEDPEGKPVYMYPEIFFQLDFTERHVVRED